jgi:hypothetical protein
MDFSGKALLGFGALVLAAAFMPPGPRDLILAALKGALQGFGERLTASAAPEEGRCAGAETHWKSAEKIGTRAIFEDHLAHFGNCSFAGLARSRLAAIDENITAPPPTGMTSHGQNEQCRAQPKGVLFTCINPTTGRSQNGCICR